MIITKDEALKIASMTKLIIQDDELDSIVKQLQDMLDYAARVQDMAKDIDIATAKNINRQRLDKVVQFDAKTILEQAPDAQDNYFVVPKIL